MIDLNNLTKIQRNMLNVVEKYGEKWLSARQLSNLVGVHRNGVQTQKFGHFLKVLKAYGKVESKKFSGYDERHIYVVKRLWRIKQRRA